MSESEAVRMRVHGHGDPRIDGILELIDTVFRGGELGQVLQQLCEQVSRIAHAEVVSVYVREQGEDGPLLVMRANVGFPVDRVGRVNLRPGEGITGFAAECMRPVSSAVADQDSHYKYVPELGEERYPSFLSIPLVLGGTALGVLNLQRREAGEFSSTEVALCTVLATSFVLALDRRRSPRDSAANEPERPRSARLSGQGLSPGRALGRAALLPTFTGLSEPCGPGPEAKDRAERAMRSVEASVSRAVRRLRDSLPDRDRHDLEVLTVVLNDQRLLDLTLSATEELGVVAGLTKVARDYAAAPFRVGSGEVDAWLRDRADAIEELCLWVCAAACDHPLRYPGSIWLLPDRVSAFGVLAASERGTAGFAVGAAVPPDSLGVRLARVAGLPLVADVQGLFGWARAGDTLLIDGDAGLVRVNPSASVLADHRHGTR